MFHPLIWCTHPHIWQVHGKRGGLLSGHDSREFLYGPHMIAFHSGRGWQIGPKRFEEVGCCCNKEVMLQSNRDLGVDWAQMPCIREAEVSCGRDVETEASVGVIGRAYIETVSCMGYP